MTCSCDEVTTGCGEFVQNAIFSVTCPVRPNVSTCSVPTSSFVTVERDSVAASSLARAIITWETVFRAVTTTTSSMDAQ